MFTHLNRKEKNLTASEGEAHHALTEAFMRSPWATLAAMHQQLTRNYDLSAQGQLSAAESKAAHASAREVNAAVNEYLKECRLFGTQPSAY